MDANGSRWSITVIRSTPTQATLLLVGPMVKVFSASGSCPHPVCLCKAADRRVVGTGTAINTPSCEGLGMRGAPWALRGQRELEDKTSQIGTSLYGRNTHTKQYK